MSQYVGVLGEFVLVVLALSTVLTVTDAVGLLPNRFARWLSRNRLSHTIAILRELGIDPRETRSAVASARIRRYIPFVSSPTELQTLLNDAKMKKQVLVGRTQPVKAKTFIDVMGHSTAPDYALRSARVLAVTMRNAIQEGKLDGTFDGILGMKQGSPLVAYEFAKLVGKPLLLHRGVSKFVSDEVDIRANFDTTLESINGLQLIMVDDSTTGGTMAVNAAQEAREFGAEISDMFVMFVPKEKDPKTVLEGIGIRLHAEE